MPTSTLTKFFFKIEFKFEVRISFSCSSLSSADFTALNYRSTCAEINALCIIYLIERTPERETEKVYSSGRQSFSKSGPV